MGPVKSDRYLKEVDEFIKDEKDRSIINGLRDATLASVESIGGTANVRSMDVWCAVLMHG